MFDKLFEKIQRIEEIEDKLLSIFEGKTWEQIALALYQILDDIDTAGDLCKENAEAFRSEVMKLQANKNRLLYSPDGYTIAKLEECACHIYELTDDMLVAFYMDMDRQYTKTGEAALKQLPEDKAEVKREIEKRGLEVPVTESELWAPVETLVRNELHNDPEIPKDDLFQNVLDGVKEDVRAEVKEILPQVYSAVISNYSESIKENLAAHARRELQLAGMFDKEVEGSEAAGSWNRLCAEAVMELMEVFAEQGHSGFSASMTQDLFSRLSKYEALTELTDNPDEWNDISEMQSGEPGWQSQRSPSCFSEDGGKSYWDINEEYYIREDEDGERFSGGLSEEEWANRPVHQTKHVEKKE